MARSQRLTVSIKDGLLEKIIENGFAGKCVALMDKECDFAARVYAAMLEKEIRTSGGSGPKKRLGVIIAELPAGWASRQTYFYATFGGDKAHLDRYDGIAESFHQNRWLIGVKPGRSKDREDWFFSPGYSFGVVLAFDASDQFTQEYRQLQNDRQELEKEVESARASARGALNSVSTVQRLIVMWPEIEAFAAPYLQEETAAKQLLPMIQREKLNDLLGLPPGAREGVAA